MAAQGTDCSLCQPARRFLVVVLVCTLAAQAGTLAETYAEPTPEELAKADQLREDMRTMIELARDRVFPALVNIEVVTMRYWGGKERKGRGVGSGTIISDEGYVLTNQHVTHNGKKFKCTLGDKQEITAELVGEDPLTDLAVLKLNLDELDDPGAPLPTARFGDSSELQTGDHVMAMGSPWALSRSVTLGIVSNAERVFAGAMGSDDPEDMQLEQGQRTGLFTKWIQHDSAINPGNSGGPLVNLKGEIVGVNELGNLLGGNMGFAIPSNLAKTVTGQLIEHGEVPRSWIGVSFKPIQNTGLDHGVLVNSIVEDGPADQAGISPGDVIIRLAGDPLTVHFPEEVPPLLKRIADLPIGTTIEVNLDREGSNIDTKVVTEKLQKDRGDEAAFRAWGLTSLEITEKMARDRRLDSTEGVWVSGVRSGGPAQLAEPPFARGDVIRSIDGQPIADLADFIERYEQIMDTDPLPEYLLVEFERRGRNHITLLKPKPDKDEDPPREAAKAWIGIATQPVLKKLAEKLDQPDVRGFRITRVYPRTKAADTDLKVGDIVVSLSGKQLKPRGMQDAGLLGRKIRRLDIDATAALGLLREGQPLEVIVPLERTRITPQEARRDRNRDFELTVREVTFFDRDENRWDEAVKGVLVDQLERAGWAGLGGVHSGDLIQKIGQYEIQGLKSYRQAMEAITEAQPERVVFVLLRGVRTRFQYIEPDWNPVSGEAKDRDETEQKQE
jgi:serine protease Do